MIKEAKSGDKNEIYDLWKIAYPNANRRYLSFYFQHHYDYGKTLMIEQDNRIIASLTCNEHILQLQQKSLLVSYILGISTLPDYRHRGHMSALMNSMLDEVSNHHLITFIEAFHPKLYEPFGFQVVYYRKQYHIHRDWLSKIIPYRVSEEASAQELLHAYQKFITYFDGYYKRDVAYFEALLKEVKQGIKKLVVYQNEEQEVEGYLIYEIVKKDVFVKEAIYRDSIALQRMLKQLVHGHDGVMVEVSQNEKLEKAFPLAIPKKTPYMMARINDLALFNKLYNTKAKNVRDAFSSIRKPLWICEKY